MRKTFNFYCDESTHLISDKQPYMLLSYVSASSNQLEIHKRYISALKLRHRFKGEIKWSNVSKSQLEFYRELINYFFATDLAFRAVIVEKSRIKTDSLEEYDDFYFKMYYQLIHHKVDMTNDFNIYVDIKDTRSYLKVRRLKKILSYNASIKNLQAIRSYESSLMQLADLLMGAINYKLRKLNKVKAKLELIQLMEEQSGGSLDRGTSPTETKFNQFFISLR